MKNIIKIFLSLMIVVSFNSCEDSDNVIDQVFNDFENGAVLRTIEIISSTVNASLPDSEWRVLFEEQDVEDGGLFQEVQVWVSIRDLTPDNGTTVAEGMIKIVPASDFTLGPLGLPRGEIGATFAEAEAAMGLTPDQTTPGDIYIYEVRLVLTNGEIYGASSAAGIITGGFFSSPFAYNALVVCSPEPGEYKVRMIDNYGDGWQGSAVRVNLDGVITDLAIPSYWDADACCRGSVGDPQWSDVETSITIPVGTLLGTFEYVAGDFPGEVEFEIFYPDGSSAGYFGPAPGPGLLPVLQCAGGM
jgi:hypothetical protein